jgi:hypothetical protein
MRPFGRGPGLREMESSLGDQRAVATAQARERMPRTALAWPGVNEGPGFTWTGEGKPFTEKRSRGKNQDFGGAGRCHGPSRPNAFTLPGPRSLSGGGSCLPEPADGLVAEIA